MPLGRKHALKTVWVLTALKTPDSALHPRFPLFAGSTKSVQNLIWFCPYVMRRSGSYCKDWEEEQRGDPEFQIYKINLFLQICMQSHWRARISGEILVCRSSKQ